MRTVRILAYHFRNAFAGIFSNRLIHAISVGTISISLFLFGAFALLFVNINSWVIEWGKSLSMSVYLEDGATQEAKKKIESMVQKFPGAQMKAFISKEKAMVDLKATLGDRKSVV
jgi:cell division transport system permease protein